MKPGPKNAITDIDGLLVGNAEDTRVKTGVTAVICEEPTIAAVAVHGGAPGTRDTELLSPENTVAGVDGIVLSGGSAFGIDATSGVQAWLREQNRGFAVGPVNVPIVPGAILFDLLNGGDKDWGKYPPYRDLGYKAAQSAGKDFDTGTAGAGTGALVADLKGGLGTASLELDNGIKVAALFAVNAIGSPLVSDTRHFHASMFERGGEFGGHGFPPSHTSQSDELRIKFRREVAPNTNTTIGILATNAKLTKAECKRLAVAAHDGIARAIWPAHTPMDGDLIFSLATGRSNTTPNPSEGIDLSAHAASVSARAIAKGVFDADAHENDMFSTYAVKYL